MPKLKEDDINELLEFCRAKQHTYPPPSYSHDMFEKAIQALCELKQLRGGIRVEGTIGR